MLFTKRYPADLDDKNEMDGACACKGGGVMRTGFWWGTQGKIPSGRPGHRWEDNINLLKPAGHVMHQQFNIQQLYSLPTLYLCVLYLSENKQRLVPLTA